MWTLYSKEVAIIINIILGIFLVVFIKNGYEIYDKLHVTDADAVTGQFKNFADVQEMDDINNRRSSLERPQSAQDLRSAEKD